MHYAWVDPCPQLSPPLIRLVQLLETPHAAPFSYYAIEPSKGYHESDLVEINPSCLGSFSWVDWKHSSNKITSLCARASKLQVNMKDITSGESANLHCVGARLRVVLRVMTITIWDCMVIVACTPENRPFLSQSAARNEDLEACAIRRNKPSTYPLSTRSSRGFSR